MKIAIVAPSSVPFTIGGAENLWWGLLHTINQHTPHQADLIKLPSPESSFWELINSYKYFSNLDLSTFDLVISGKYPAWMVHHPNHICYMLHRLRGLYDTYHFSGCSETYEPNHQKIVDLQKFIQKNQGYRKALNELFERLNEIKFCQDIPPEIFQFPGPFVRDIIHFLDNIGLAANAIKSYAAISQTVANRAKYFPEGTFVKAIYPPSNLKYFRQGKSDYLFTASRLDSAKRVGLLIEAMKYVKANIELKIAGTGPDATYLQQLAKNDKRISFLGFVNDRELIDLYADALAVPYVPYDEDYGLITIEAMMSGKPVITTIDAGGTNEFVSNGETGYSVPPDPKAIAQHIDYLCEHPDQAQKMGLAGQKLVQKITWEETVARLLEEPKHYQPIRIPKVRQKITVALTFPVFPPRGGGQSRVFHLYRHLADEFDIEMVTLTHINEPPFKAEIAPGLWETRIPKSAQHQQQEWAIEQKVGVPITDIAMVALYQLTPAYLEALKDATNSSDFIVACHPYLLPAIQEVSDKPIWYEAQDVEIELKKSILPDNAAAQELLQAVSTVERKCCELSQLIWVCSQDDAELLNKIYAIDLGKTIVVPNGVDLETVSYVPLEKRILKQQQLNLNVTTALFIGSWHGPNLDAVRFIFDLAISMPDVIFLVIGSVGLAFQNEQIPANISFMGVVDDDTKDVVLGLADVALNPIVSGSGTNLKMLDYFGAGIPVISTPFGARGLDIVNEKQCIIAELDNFLVALNQFKNEDVSSKKMRIEIARKHSEDKFNWTVIASDLSKKLLD